MSTPKTTKFTLKRIVENLNKIPHKGFSEETPKLTTEKKRRLLEMAAMFESYGEFIKNEESIINSAKGLMELCELAEMYAVNECGDWFQQDIVKRDMKEVKKRVVEYNKIAKECYSRMQQLGVAYQDIGHVLGRYYDLTNPKKKEGQKQTLQNEDEGVSEDLERVCAWCQKKMGTTPSDNNGITHTICDPCKEKLLQDIPSLKGNENPDEMLNKSLPGNSKTS